MLQARVDVNAGIVRVIERGAWLLALARSAVCTRACWGRHIFAGGILSARAGLARIQLKASA